LSPRLSRAAGVVGLLLALLIGARADAESFRVGEVRGLVDVSVAYGLLARVESRDKDFVGIGNGGKAASVNFDNGNLNYDKGIVSNQARVTGELTLGWRNFGAYVRGYGFYDFETELSDRERTSLSGDAEDQVGSGGALQDYYLSGSFHPGGLPIQVRIGNQVINWGETGFLRFGVDVVNPLDLVAVVIPTTTVDDVFVRQGMIWVAANLTESVGVEAFYQYDWKKAKLPPIGWFLSGDDLIGNDRIGVGFEGFGMYSDQGTDLDAAFDLPPGTLGFDKEFMLIPSAGRDKPSSQGQFGVTLQTFVSALNSAKVALHFMNYHSRLPLISGRTADALAVSFTTDAAVDDRAADLALQADISFDDARAIEETLTVGRFTNETRYFAKYPENIQMLGISFSTATINTGTLVSGEVSHHFDRPIQISKEEVLIASLSPIQFTDDFAQTSLGAFGPSQTVKGYRRTGKTQVSMGLIQLLGPRLGASQTLLGFDIGYVHFDDIPRGQVADRDSWGYRLQGGLTYQGIFGGFNLLPRIAWIHDVDGVSAGPGAAFVEDRKTLILGLGVNYTNTWTANLSYTRVSGGKPLNILADRDFFRFNVTLHY
jgi:hypothetical protein